MIRIFLIAALLFVMPCFADEYTPELIKDEFVETTLQNVSNVYPKPNLDYDYRDTDIKTEKSAVYYKPLKIDDNLVRVHLKNVSGEYPKAHLKYDYTSIKYIPIKLRFYHEISSRAHTNTEGQIVKFEIVQDVYDGKKKLLPRGTVGHAKVETISPNGFMGVPAEIIISNFELNGFDGEKFESGIVKSGWNLMALSAALKYSIGTFIPGTGYTFMLIKGGHAKIRTDEIFELRYLP